METNVDWHSVCLVCLQEGIMHSIYEDDEMGFKLIEKIMKCTNIDFSSESNFPEQICASCVSDLSAALRFQTNCENSHGILKSLFVDDTNRSFSEMDDDKIVEDNDNGFDNSNIDDNDDRMDCASLLLTPKKRYNKESEIIHKETVKVEFVEEHLEENVPLNNIADDLDEDTFPNLTQFLKKKAVSQAKCVSDNLMKETYNTKTKTRSKIKPPKRYIQSSETKRKNIRYKEENKALDAIVNKTAKEIRENEMESSISAKTSTGEFIDKNEKLVCEICGNTYKHANALRVHMLRHENVKQFKCELCPKAFVADTDLKRHMRVHTGEKPYPCRYCDRRFSDFGSRGKHERTHTGERPYKCQRCNKSFSYSHVLNVHQLVHTGIKKFKCNMCDKGFTKKLYLDNHMKNHNCQTQYTINHLKENMNNMKVLKIENSNNVKTSTYETEVNEEIDEELEEETETIEITAPQKSIFTIVKTESGLAEVQYYLPLD